MPPKTVQQPLHVRIGTQCGWHPQITALAHPTAANTTNGMAVQAQRYAREVVRLWPQGYSQADNNTRAAIARYASIFGPGAQHLPFHTARAIGSERELSVRFFRNNSRYAMPKCNFCATNNSPMPQSDQIPIGLDQQDTLACGCLYVDAMFDQWMYEKHMYGPRQNTVGGRSSFTSKADRSVALEVFENFVGPWTFNKTVDRTARGNANTILLNAANGINCGIHGT